MLAKLTSWLLFISIATSGLINQTLVPPLGIRYLTITRLFITCFILIIWLRLLIEKKIVLTFKEIFFDKASKIVVLGMSGLLIWQIISNISSNYPLDGLSFQLQWLEIAAVLITILFAIKAGYFRIIKISYLLVSIIISHTINITFAISQFLIFIKNRHIEDIFQFYITGSMWYTQSFSVFSVMALPILWSSLDLIKPQKKAQKIFIFSLIIATCFLLPFSGSRSGTLSFAVLFILWPLLSPRTVRVSIMSISLVIFLIGNFFIDSPNILNKEDRALKLNIPSTFCRYYLFLTDISIIVKNPITGIGMGIDNYKKHVLKEQSFHAFEQIDPFVAKKPFSHSGTIGIAVSSGFPGFIFFFMTMVGILVILWRSSLWSKEPILNKSFLCSFLIFQSGFLFHPLYGEWPWFILMAGLLLAYNSMPKCTSVFSFFPLLKTSFSEFFSAVLNIVWELKKFSKSRNKLTDINIKSITFLGLIGLGDWIVVLPVLEAFKEKYPSASITVLTNRLGEQTLQLSSVKTKAVVLPDFSRGVVKFFKIISWLNRTRQELKADLLVSLWWHPTHQFLACLMLFKFYYGFFTCRGIATSNMHNMIYYLESNISQTKMAHREVEWFGNMRKVLISGLGINIPENPLICDNTIWRRTDICTLGNFLIVCQPNCLFENKSWNIENFAKTLLEIHKKAKVSIVLIGVKDDQNICERLNKNLIKNGANVINLCGKTSIAQLAGVLKTADLFLGTDSGPGHLAAAVGTPSVILYGPTKPENFLPIAFNGVAVYHEIECSPCGIPYCLLNNENRYLCMNQIKPEEVTESELKLLSKL